MAVVDLLAGEDCCLSAQEIVERLRGRGDRVGTASVYRALDLLHKTGLVMRVDLGDGGARYEAVRPGGDHHHHAVCDRCGQITQFEDPALERAIDRLGTRLGHRVSGHDVIIRGECPGCTRAS
jgi:Fur family ferric uptake transcriptional regulator